VEEKGGRKHSYKISSEGLAAIKDYVEKETIAVQLFYCGGQFSKYAQKSDRSKGGWGPGARQLEKFSVYFTRIYLLPFSNID
jgi:hypothetical protein